MKTQRLLFALTFLNLALLAFTLAQTHPAAAAGASATVLRARALEIVDADGRVRASIAVLPAAAGKDGAEPHRETVLLRLITERGRPSVKIAASEEQAGLSFAGPTGTSRTWVRLGSKGDASFLELRNEDGKERLLEP